MEISLASAPELKAQIDDVYNDFNVSGLPVSGAKKPKKPDIRPLMKSMVDISVSAGTTLVFSTVAEMEASADPSAIGARAEVRADPSGDVEGGNGIWSWDGADWQWISSLIPAAVETALDTKEPSANKTATFSVTPGNVKFPTEKLVKDSLNAQAEWTTDQVGNVQSNLNAEVARATAAENARELTANKTTTFSATPGNTKFPTEKLVKDSLNDLAAWATTQVGNVQTNLNNEAASRTTADTNLQTNINNEVNRATAAEALLAPKDSPAFTGKPTSTDGLPEDRSARITTNSFLSNIVRAGLPTGVMFAGIDNTPQGNAAFWVTDDGVWHSPYFDALSGASEIYTDTDLPAGVLFALTDSTPQKNRALIVREDDLFTVENPYIDKIRADLNRSLQTSDAGYWDYLRVDGRYTLLGSAWYGQSHSVGAATGSAISTTPLDYAYMFSAVRTAPAEGVTPVDRTALQGLAESNDAYGGGRGETGASGAAMMIAQMVLADTGTALGDNGQSLMFANPGFGGQSVITLSPGGVYFGAMEDDIDASAELAGDAGLFYALMNIDVLQGEADVTRNPDEWAAAWETTRLAAQSVAAAAQGFERVIPIIWQQTNANVQYGSDVPSIGLRQLELAISNDNYALSSPSFIFPRSASVPHYTAAGSRWNGAYFGLAKYDWFFRGVKPDALYPLPFRRQGKRIMQPFHVPVGNLKTYTSASVPAQDNYGVKYVDSAGDDLTIVDIQIVGKSLIIEFDGDVPSGVEGRFGWNGSPTQPGMTNLRDERATIFHAPDGDYTMYHHLGQSVSHEEK